MACTCNVGDSLAYVYSPSQGHVREITQGSHDIQSNRDMRDALGKVVTKSLDIKYAYVAVFALQVLWDPWTVLIRN